MNFYAYCLSDEIASGSLGSIQGVGGAAVNSLEFEGITAVVSSFTEKRAAVTRESVLAHERVVRQVFARHTLLPFRFGNVTSEERLRSFIASQKQILEEQLNRARGCVEMSVKVIGGVDEKHERLARSQGGPALNSPQPSGTEFLEMRRREMAGDERSRERAEEIARWLEGVTNGLARASAVTLPVFGSHLISVSHLVERVRLPEYREKLRQALETRLRIHFLTSGPWPPYSFSQINS